VLRFERCQKRPFHRICCGVADRGPP
jgi:hypothetical protein